MMTTDLRRSQTMRAIKSKDTTPEMIVRRLVYGLGYRYRLHRRDLPGCPDLVFGPRRKIIFVHGCFWHQHECPRGARPPKSNQDYWLPKLQRNKCRDEKNLILLAELTWRTLVIWECETKDRKALGARIHKFLEE